MLSTLGGREREGELERGRRASVSESTLKVVDKYISLKLVDPGQKINVAYYLVMHLQQFLSGRIC